MTFGFSLSEVNSGIGVQNLVHTRVLASENTPIEGRTWRCSTPVPQQGIHLFVHVGAHHGGQGREREFKGNLDYHYLGAVPLGGIFIIYLFECTHHGELEPSETMGQNEFSTPSTDSVSYFHDSGEKSN